MPCCWFCDGCCCTIILPPAADAAAFDVATLVPGAVALDVLSADGFSFCTPAPTNWAVIKGEFAGFGFCLTERLIDLVT